MNEGQRAPDIMTGYAIGLVAFAIVYVAVEVVSAIARWLTGAG